MILPDGTQPSPTKTAFAPVDARSGQGSDQPPPTYRESGAETTLLAVPPAEMNYMRRESAAERFIKAFCVAALVWFLSAMLVQSIVDVAYRGHGRHGHWDGSDGREWPLPGDGHVGKCIGGDDWAFDTNNAPPTSVPSVNPRITASPQLPFHANTSFTLPVSATVLYFFSRGASSYGTFNIIASEDVGDNVKVDIVVSYQSRQALDRANVCLLGRGDAEHGVGIFTPRWNREVSTNQLRFDVTVHLPFSSQNSPLVINNLVTDFSNYAHTIGNLKGVVEFSSLGLKTSNAPITANTLHAKHANIKSSNGPISGSYNTSSSLRLETSNARIAVDVELNNSGAGKPTELLLKTSNGPIDSNISMYSRSSSSKAAYKVTSKTSNSALKVGFAEQPVDSQLHLDAATSNAPASVSLHPAYEGKFSLQSSVLRPRIESHEVEDPAGKGRRRSIEIRQVVRSNVEGQVHWGEQRDNDSWVRMRTSNMPAVLKL